MTINVPLNQLVNLQNENTAVTQINQNSDTITTAFSSALNTTGDQMQGTLDVNSNQIINLPTPATANSPLRLQDLNTFIGGGTIATLPAGGISGQVLIKTGTGAYTTSWGTGATTAIVAGTGLTLSGTTVSITNTAVTSGTYGASASVPVIVINAQGQITSATTVGVSLPASGAASGTYGATGTTVQVIVSASGVVTSVTSVNIGIAGSQIISGSVAGARISSISLGAGNVNGGVNGNLPFTNLVGTDIASLGTITTGTWNVPGTNMTTANLTAATGNITSVTSTTITSSGLTVSSTAKMPDSSVWSASGITSVTSAILNLNPAGAALAGQLQWIGTAAVGGGVCVTNYGASGNNLFQAAGGTPTSPTSITSGAGLGALAFQGYVTSSGAFSATKARVSVFASEATGWTATAQGCYIEFDTTASGSVTRAQSLRAMAGVIIGTGTVDPGQGNLVAGGSISAGSFIVTNGYTVTSLPAGVTGAIAYVTDAVAPTFLGALTGGGTTKTPVFYNGSAWVAN